MRPRQRCGVCACKSGGSTKHIYQINSLQISTKNSYHWKTNRSKPIQRIFAPFRTLLRNFRKKEVSLFRPKPKSLFGIHDPQGIHYLFQLRIGLSPLRNHKKHYNFADIPSDTYICSQGIGNTSHFLFHCPFYITY